MKSALIVLGSILICLAIIVSAFFATIVLVEYIYLGLNKAANHDGQGGIAALDLWSPCGCANSTLCGLLLALMLSQSNAEDGHDPSSKQIA